MPISEDVAAIREDVAYIKANIAHLVEGHNDHEDRIRKTEKFQWASPLTAILAILGLHFGN